MSVGHDRKARVVSDDSYRKRLTRERMEITSEPYNVARRAVMGVDDHLAEADLGRLFDDIRSVISTGRGRLKVVHGFEESIAGRNFRIKVPVVWKPEKDSLFAMASAEPTDKEVEELRELIETDLPQASTHMPVR